MTINGYRWIRRTVVAAATIAALLLGPTRARAGEALPQSSLAVQAGWWTVELDWKTKWGVFAAAGVPWVAAALSSSAQWMVPYSARLGYQHDLSPTLKLRGAAHVAGTYGRENPCGDCGEIVSRTFGFVEVGARYQAASGFVAGIDVPVFALGKSGRDVYPPPLSFAFSQAYVGFAWRW